MKSTKKLYRAFQSSAGRVKLVTLSGIGLLAALLVLVFAVIPASAGAGDESKTHFVYPEQVSYGGGAGACFADIPGRLPTAATYELHINNPSTNTYTGPDGTQVRITVDAKDEFFDFVFLNNPAMAAFDVVVNGGSQNTHFDYDDHPGPGGEPFPGPQRADTKLHAPTKGGGNRLYSLSHINICYDVNPIADLSITKTPVPAVPVGEPFVADVGEQVTFEIEVTNSLDSTVPATNVEVTDTLPTGMTFVSASNGGVEDPTGTVTWMIPAISNTAPNNSVTLTLVVEITQEAAGSEVTNSVTAIGDPNLDPGGESAADSVPAVTVTGEVTGKKWHDKDTDGTLDPTEEPVLAGWTIAAFDPADLPASATPVDTDVTAFDGTYTLMLPPGTYTICEATNTSGLPGGGPGFLWAWTQSDLSASTWDADCTGYTNYEPVGHTVVVDDDIIDIDFGNYRQLSVSCNGNTVPISVALGDPVDGTTDDDPLATVVFPPGCQSASFTTSFEVGRSDDADAYSQFFLFGGDPNVAQELELTIEWDAEAEKKDANGALVVPTTLVQLFEGGPIAPAVFCSSIGGGPTPAVPYCIDSRTITQGSPLDPGFIQVTERGRVLGDPRGFR